LFLQRERGKREKKTCGVAGREGMEAHGGRETDSFRSVDGKRGYYSIVGREGGLIRMQKGKSNSSAYPFSLGAPRAFLVASRKEIIQRRRLSILIGPLPFPSGFRPPGRGERRQGKKRCGSSGGRPCFAFLPFGANSIKGGVWPTAERNLLTGGEEECSSSRRGIVLFDR